MNDKSLFIPDEEAMLAEGAKLAKSTQAGNVIFLQGELGAGKTTLTRGFLRALGYKGIVKSPTYTLLETFQLPDILLYHFDLYRLIRPEDIKEIGLSDYLTEDAICLIEWPEKAKGFLPEPTVCCKIDVPENGVGRLILITRC